MIHHGDCLDVMAAMEPESVDAIVTDPPYGLGFMGKAWDNPAGADRCYGPGKGWEEGEDHSWVPHVLSTPEHPKGGEVCVRCDKHRTVSPMRRRAEVDAVNVGMSRQGGRQWAGEDGQKRQARDMRTYQDWCEDWGRAMLRVAKPSAYLLAFGGTRTVHRMTVALEDAGWIIRDMLVWGYASGFPKSKASLKPAWEPIVMARKPGPLRMLAIDECRIGFDNDAADPATNPLYRSENGYKNEHPGDSPFHKGTVTERPANALGRWPANIVLTDPIFDGGIEGVVGGGQADGATSFSRPREYSGSSYVVGDAVLQPGYGDTGTYSRFFTIPEGGTMCEWCGASPAEASSRQRSGHGVSVADPAPTEASSDGITPTDSPTTSVTEQTSWHDESVSTSRNAASPASRLVVPSRSARAKSAAPRRTSSGITMITESRWMCDSCADAATRFSMAEQESAERNWPWAYLIPKAARSDREPVLGGLPQVQARASIHSDPDAAWSHKNPNHPRANVHPTVKPTDLMRHLVRLVTPAGGTVLDPFLGSGTTGLAAEMEGFAWVGIEREAEYVAIAEARLNGTQRGLGI